MNARQFLIAVAWFALSTTAAAADLSKIDRTIAKEPAGRWRRAGKGKSCCGTWRT